VFKLQQFAINQDNCAMKVCTDSLIFGAMAPIKRNERVIDIGTGTGLLSLMAKQQGAAKVIAIDLVASAVIQAQDNVNESPWPDDIEVIHQDIRDYRCDKQFDLVIANPPFFEHHLKSKNRGRNAARHTDTMSYQSLISSATNLITETGLIYLLIPLHAKDAIIDIATQHALSLWRQTDYITITGAKPKLCALTLSRNTASKAIFEQLTVYQAHQQYTSQSQQILEPYLLRFAKN